tara:strand:- start:184 stop:1227 length:1044 start_codon:yes stop_codon:yes gene_type:complete
MDFRTSQISFCNKKALNIVSDKFKSFLLGNIREQYNISISDRYAHVINKRSAGNLSKNPHLISLKTGGSNYYLFMTRINGEKRCFYIDRRIKNGYTYPRIISAQYNFSDDCFQNTLLDGELIRDYDNDWLFLIFDIRCYKGVNQKGVSVINKIRNIYSLFDCYKTSESDLCRLEVKKFFNYSEFDEVVNNFIPSLNYRVTGLFFNTLNTKHHNYLYFFPRKDIVQKRKTVKNEFTGSSVNVNVTQEVKPPVKEDTLTKVFIIKDTPQPDVYHLYCIKDNNLVKYGLAYISTSKCSKFVKSIFVNHNKDTDIKVNCSYNKRFTKWEPLSLSSVYFPDSFTAIQKIENV